jgi:hypothetical protein
LTLHPLEGSGSLQRGAEHVLLPAALRSRGVKTMMTGSGAMTGGMMILWILVAVLLLLGIAALLKYLFTKG